MSPNELNRLYRDHAASLYAFLSYRTGDRVLAEDLLADTFERVLIARRGFDRRKASERTWLYAIALNCVRDEARRTSVETRALVSAGSRVARGGGTVTMEDGLGERDAIRAALAVLSEDEREAVVLRYGSDLSLAEVASVLRIPRSKAETRIYRSLKKLREHLEPEL
jgi:RNA polymerase sigma factor (sigma-70 family)